MVTQSTTPGGSLMPKIAQANRIRFTEAVVARLKPPVEGEIIWWDSDYPDARSARQQDRAQDLDPRTGARRCTPSNSYRTPIRRSPQAFGRRGVRHLHALARERVKPALYRDVNRVKLVRRDPFSDALLY